MSVCPSRTHHTRSAPNSLPKAVAFCAMFFTLVVATTHSMARDAASPSTPGMAFQCSLGRATVFIARAAMSSGISGRTDRSMALKHATDSGGRKEHS